MACNPKPFRRELKADMAWFRRMQKDGKVQNRYSPSRRQNRERGREPKRPAPVHLTGKLSACFVLPAFDGADWEPTSPQDNKMGDS